MKYQLIGGNFPAVVCTLENGESMTTQQGGMIWMSPDMKMETKGTSIGKAMGRMLTGESIFQNIYTCHAPQGLIAFGASCPGTIKPVALGPGQSVIAQKRAFLAGTPGITLSTFFQKKMMTGFFSGEGFIMQKITGPGLVFLEIDGAEQTYVLQPGQQLVVDSGNLAMVEETCKLEVQSVQGLKNKMFGGEGFFNTLVTGPGKVVLQTMPISAMASVMAQFSSGSH